MKNGAAEYHLVSTPSSDAEDRAILDGVANDGIEIVWAFDMRNESDMLTRRAHGSLNVDGMHHARSFILGRNTCSIAAAPRPALRRVRFRLHLQPTEDEV